MKHMKGEDSLEEKHSIEGFVRKVIDDRIVLPKPIESIGKQEKLELYGLDPLNIVEISADIEKEYKIIVNDDNFVNQSLSTIEDFCIYIINNIKSAD